VSFIAVCTNTILTSEAEIKKQFGSAPNIKNYITSDKSISSGVAEEIKKQLSKIKDDDIKRLSSTCYIF